MPPFQDEYVVCARCESKIKMLVIEGDPGYIIGADSDGTPKLLPVQGSSQPHPNTLSASERENLLAISVRGLERKRDDMASPTEQILLVDKNGQRMDLSWK